MCFMHSEKTQSTRARVCVIFRAGLFQESSVHFPSVKIVNFNNEKNTHDLFLALLWYHCRSFSEIHHISTKVWDGDIDSRSQMVAGQILRL